MPYYIGDLKRDPNLENYPYAPSDKHIRLGSWNLFNVVSCSVNPPSLNKDYNACTDQGSIRDLVVSPGLKRLSLRLVRIVSD